MGVLQESRIPLRPAPGRAGDGAGAPGGPCAGWTRLRFDMQRQLQSQWCWAATSVSLSRYYAKASVWTQCRLVTQITGRRSCCETGNSPECNLPQQLGPPLERVGILERWKDGAARYDDLRREIDEGRPMAWRIGWAGGGGHFAVIEGYQADGERWVAVEDPLFGSSDAPLAALTGGHYQGSGKWTHTYFTRRPRREG